MRAAPANDAREHLLLLVLHQVLRLIRVTVVVHRSATVVDVRSFAQSRRERVV
jgi:hypothetical protein